MKKRRREEGRFRASRPAAVTIRALWLAAALWVAAVPVSADIYKYVDAEGVLHFTNTPTENGFILYMREKGSGSAPVFRPGSKSYDAIIQAAGERFGLDTALIKAVIRAESGFNPQAVSRKGARGLMQIMPENNSSLNISNAFDPTQNIMGGTAYLKRLLLRYQNRLALALAAYNAGPTIVDQYGEIPPISETRTYVRKVMKFYDFYKRI